MGTRSSNNLLPIPIHSEGSFHLEISSEIRYSFLLMQTFTAIVEFCTVTDLYVGYISGLPGAHSQGKTPEELNENLKEVVTMILEEGTPEMESTFVGTQVVVVP